MRALPRRLLLWSAAAGLAALAVFLLLSALAPVTVPRGAGFFELTGPGDVVTEWVAVPPGFAAVYETDSDLYINYWAEVLGKPPVAGDDGWGMRGCVVSQEPFALRLRWSQDWLHLGESAQVSYGIQVVEDPGGCDVAEQEAGRHGSVAPGGLGTEGAAVVAGSVVAAVGVVAEIARRLSRPKPVNIPEGGEQPGRPGVPPR